LKNLPKIRQDFSLFSAKNLWILLNFNMMCIETLHRLEKGMVLKVRIPVKENSVGAPTLVQVMWVMYGIKSRGFRTGLRFII
jgi:hypothetical protein